MVLGILISTRRRGQSESPVTPVRTVRCVNWAGSPVLLGGCGAQDRWHRPRDEVSHVELIDLLAPLLLLADFAYREFARRTDRRLGRPAAEAPLPPPVSAGVQVYAGIYLRDDSEY
jgi:hypothetical protein